MNIRGVELAGSWTPEEANELVKILKPLPAAWLERNPHLRSIIRQKVLTDGPPEAPGHSKYEPAIASIVLFDKGVYHDREIDPEQFRRSVYHELAHTIVRSNRGILDEWQQSTRDDGFVDEYAKTNPEEDLCDTFSEFFIHRDKTHDAVPAKAKFIEQMLERASEEKVAMHFLRGFSDELTKVAGPGAGRLARAMRIFGRSARSSSHGSSSRGVLKTLGLTAGTGATAGAIGAHEGKKKGYSAGTDDLVDVAQQARQLGRREGVMAYHNALMARKQGGG